MALAKASFTGSGGASSSCGFWSAEEARFGVKEEKGLVRKRRTAGLAEEELSWVGAKAQAEGGKDEEAIRGRERFGDWLDLLHVFMWLC